MKASFQTRVTEWMLQCFPHPVFDFTPLYYILDKQCKWVMAVRKEEKYELKGVYFAIYDSGWEIWPACKNKQQPYEYSSDMDLTKDFDDAIKHAIIYRNKPNTQDVLRERVEGYPVY